MVLGDCHSLPWPLTCGVPQGLVLSPIKFNMYTRLLGEVMRRGGGGRECHQYENDTQLYLSLQSDSREAVDTLNRHLEVIMGWMGAS